MRVEPYKFGGAQKAGQTPQLGQVICIYTEGQKAGLTRIWGSTPGPPHSGVGGTACVFPKSPVKGYFSCDKVRPENCKKRGVFDFSPGDFF